MSDFFELPPRPSEPEPLRYRTPPWLGPPSGTLAAVVPIDRVLAATEKLAVCVSRASVYPAGFELEVVTFSDDERSQLDLLPFGGPGGRSAQEALRIGVQFADGSKATNVGGFDPSGGPPAAPVLHERGGSGGGGKWRQTVWVWPIPPPGPLVLACEWPALGIPLSRAEIDAGPIVDAARRAQVLFSEDHLPERPRDDGPAAAAS